MFLNRQETPVTIHRGKKLGYMLPRYTEYRSVENLKFELTENPLHANKECRLKKLNELKSFKKCFLCNWRQKKGCLVNQSPLKIAGHRISSEQTSLT